MGGVTLLTWKSMLQPIEFVIPYTSTVLEAILTLEQQEAPLLFVRDAKEEIIGYIDRNSLFKQIKKVDDLQQPIDVQEDIVKVPETAPITFFHNISVIVGVNGENQIIGFMTKGEAKNHLDQYKLDQLNHIFNSSGTGIVTTDTEFVVTFMNDTAERILGLPKNVLAGRNYQKLLSTEKELSSVLKGKQLFSIDSMINSKKISGNFLPLYEHGKIMGIVHIFSRDTSKVSELKAALEQEKKKSEEYKQELDELRQDRQRHLVYRSPIMERLVVELIHISKVDSTVLLIGESGVGKEVFAKTIHEYSPRQSEPFIRVNCGAIPESLVESELFGYEKGAFTGANQKGKPGLFELAQNGTLFLDEITELPYNMQVKLLRVLQEREIMRVGGTKNVAIDVRVIAATNKDIKLLVEQNKFREDLYYRLNVVPIEIPPLRKRVLDIVPLSIHFLQHFNNMYKLEKSLTKEATEVLEAYDWPGNVRELQNVVERLVVTTRSQTIQATDVLGNLYEGVTLDKPNKPIIAEVTPLKEAVENFESQLISLALQKYGNASKAAKALGISPATISRRMQKLFT